MREDEEVQNNVLKVEDIEMVKTLVSPGIRTLGLVKEFNENVRKSMRTVPIVTALASLEMLRELRKIRELLEAKEEGKSDKKKKKID